MPLKYLRQFIFQNYYYKWIVFWKEVAIICWKSVAILDPSKATDKKFCKLSKTVEKPNNNDKKSITL